VSAQVSRSGPPPWSGGTDLEQWSCGTFVAHVANLRHVPCSPAQSAGAGRGGRHRYRDGGRHL